MIHGQLAATVADETAYTDRLVRILESIHDHRESVRTGISECINFETTLLRAAERGQSRAIDALLRDLRELRNGAVQSDGEVADGHGGQKSRLPSTIQTMLHEKFRAKLSILEPDGE
jgi:hypothetical protein